MKTLTRRVISSGLAGSVALFARLDDATGPLSLRIAAGFLIGVGALTVVDAVCDQFGLLVTERR